MLTPFLLGTSKQTSHRQTDVFLSASPCLSRWASGFPALWRVMGLTSCWPHHKAGGKTHPYFGSCCCTPLHILACECLLFCVQPHFGTMKGRRLRYFRCHVTQTFPTFPLRKSVRLRAQGGESPACFVPGTQWKCSRSCSVRRLYVSLYLTQLLWECRGHRRSGMT